MRWTAGGEKRSAREEGVGRLEVSDRRRHAVLCWMSMVLGVRVGDRVRVDQNQRCGEHEIWYQGRLIGCPVQKCLETCSTGRTVREPESGR